MPAQARITPRVVCRRASLTLRDARRGSTQDEAGVHRSSGAGARTPERLASLHVSAAGTSGKAPADQSVDRFVDLAHSRIGPWTAAVTRQNGHRACYGELYLQVRKVTPAGFEPALPPPEAGGQHPPQPPPADSSHRSTVSSLPRLLWSTGVRSTNQSTTVIASASTIRLSWLS